MINNIFYKTLLNNKSSHNAIQAARKIVKLEKEIDSIKEMIDGSNPTSVRIFEKTISEKTLELKKLQEIALEETTY